MHLLAEKMSQGKFHLSERSARSADGLAHARFGPNRRVNLHTINEMARLTANMMNMMDNRPELNDESPKDDAS